MGCNACKCKCSMAVTVDPSHFEQSGSFTVTAIRFVCDDQGNPTAEVDSDYNGSCQVQVSPSGGVVSLASNTMNFVEGRSDPEHPVTGTVTLSPGMRSQAVTISVYDMDEAVCGSTKLEIVSYTYDITRRCSRYSTPEPGEALWVRGTNGSCGIVVYTGEDAVGFVPYRRTMILGPIPCPSLGPVEGCRDATWTVCWVLA